MNKTWREIYDAVSDGKLCYVKNIDTDNGDINVYDIGYLTEISGFPTDGLGYVYRVSFVPNFISFDPATISYFTYSPDGYPQLSDVN